MPRELNVRGIRSPRGGNWHSSSVDNVLSFPARVFGQRNTRCLFIGGKNRIDHDRSAALKGGNITGVSTIAVELGQKRLELLRDLLPKAVAIGFLMNPGSPNTAFDLPDMQVATRGLGQQLD